jgi:alpha-tubulin suppressor-like RCC1 family protein
MPNYSGMWTLQAQMQATAAGNWPIVFQSGMIGWGANNAGQLGTNSTVSTSSPVQVNAIATWGYLTKGSSSVGMATKNDGTMWSWGNNTDGKLGQNDRVNRSSPTQVGALTNWSKVAVGVNASYAIKTDGTLWAWGKNEWGQLGQNDRVYRSSPVQVGADTIWASVEAGSANVFAIKTNGTLWSWGYGGSGALGQGGTIDRSSPVQVGALTNWSKLGILNNTTFSIKTNGTLWSWGGNSVGQLAQNLGYSTSLFSPVQVGALTTWSTIGVAPNGYGQLSIKTDGTLWAWGQNSNGQLGTNNTIYRSSPVQVGLLTTWSILALGTSSCGAIKTDGSMWAWGSNSGGELGQNNTINRSSPVQVGTSTYWTNAYSFGDGFIALIS